MSEPPHRRLRPPPPQIRRSAAALLPSLLRCCIAAAERGVPGASPAAVAEFLGAAWGPLLEALRKVRPSFGGGAGGSWGQVGAGRGKAAR